MGAGAAAGAAAPAPVPKGKALITADATKRKSAAPLASVASVRIGATQNGIDTRGTSEREGSRAGSVRVRKGQRARIVSPFVSRADRAANRAAAQVRLDRRVRGGIERIVYVRG